MTEELTEKRINLSLLTLKTVIVHTVTYFVAGILAYTLGGYEKTFSQPPLSYFMRPEIAAVTIARLKAPDIKELLVAGRSLDICGRSLV